MAPYDGDLTELFTDAFFAPAHRADGPSPASPYLGLRHLQSRLGDQRPLLADHARLRAVLELSAMTDPRLFFAMFLHHCMAIGVALDFGAPHEDVARLASGQWIGAALMNETGHGNSSSAIRTQAVFDPAAREFVLHTPTPEAAKRPANVGLDGFARLAVVSARLRAGGADRGTALFLVPLRDENGPCEGVTIEPLAPTPLLPMDYAKVRFDRVRMPYRSWLRDGASIAGDGSFHDPLGPDARTRRSVGMSRFAWGAVTVGLAAAARAGVALALTHARHRRTHDRLAGDIEAIAHLNQQRLLFGAAADALAATAVARRTTALGWHIPPGGGVGTGPSAAEMRTLALNKVTVAVLADSAVTRCRSACGALGFFPEHGLIDYQALTTAFLSAGGDNRLIMLDAAWAMATCPDCVPPDDETAPGSWPRLFRTRERLLHAELTSALHTGSQGGTVHFETWNAQTELAQRLAEAHTARTTAESLHGTWCAPEVSETARPLLRDLYRLHCLEQTAPHAGWYLARGLVTPGEVLALPERINEICRRLVPHAEALTELLEIPDELLRSERRCRTRHRPTGMG
ncbi:acyl-CoA dehydrogenase [Streptoverticillium reticulum]|uniref:acyl-CoA dehydrogenase n=1 Tax=Streptoverticillium reticulum TaxID=1433415 RepID=UPI0039BFBB91